MKNKKLRLAVMLCLHVAVFGTGWLHGAVSATGVPTSIPNNTLRLNESMSTYQTSGRKLTSSDNRYIFDIRESKGRHALALRDTKYRSQICWKATAFEDSGAANLVLRTNGNLVFEDSVGTVKWESGTGGMGVTRLTLSDDGSLSLYAKDKLIRSLYSVTSHLPGALSVDKQKGEWTLVVVPDLQGYSEDWSERGYDYEKMKTALGWIRSVKSELNIKVVQSVGDMIELNNTTEWDRVQECWDALLESGIPAIPCGGNHEMYDKYVMLNKYYPPSKLQNYPWWKGHKNGVQNSYQLFEIGAEKYLFITMEFLPSADLMNWANDVIAAHQDRKVVFTTHVLDSRKEVYKQVVDVESNNIVMALAGHVPSERHWVGKHGCNNFVQDYQAWSEKMNLRYFKFKPLEDRVEWFTYSPIEKEWETDYYSQGSFTLVQKDPGDELKTK